jgi:hypothetical protein
MMPFIDDSATHLLERMSADTGTKHTNPINVHAHYQVCARERTA